MLERKMFDKLISLRLHPKGWLFVRWGAVLTIIFLVGNWWTLAKLCVALTVLVALFFRDPQRIVIDAPHGIVSPADGVIMEITEENPPAELNLPPKQWTKIGIFLAPWHPHIQRIPCAGRVMQKEYKKGVFSHVVRTVTQDGNERLSLLLESAEKESVVCVQIAGFLARRIICDVQEGQWLNQGQRYGIICFGSRVDLYVPRSSHIWMSIGQRVLAGESLLGFLPSQSIPVANAVAPQLL